VRENYAYVADYSGGLAIVDISNLSSPAIVGTYDTQGSARDVAILGDVAFLADGSEGLITIDISDPLNPAVMGKKKLSDTAWGVAIKENYAYVACNEAGLVVVDVSNPFNMQVVGSADTTGNSYKVFIRQNHAFVADFCGGVYAIDISNPLNPEILSYYDTAGKAEDVFVSRETVFVADGDVDGFVILNASDIYRMNQVSYFDTPNYAAGVYNLGNYAVVGDMDGGVFVFDIRNTSSITQLTYLDTEGSANGVLLDRGVVFVAEGESGLGIYSFCVPEI